MHKREAGLSLVELMISITLGIVLMTGVVQIFLSSKSVFSSQQGLSRIQETGRLGIEFLGRDIRMAAYYGCYRPNPSVPGGELQNGAMVISGLHGNFAEGLRGYDSATSVPGGAAALGGSITPLTKGTANVVVVRSVKIAGLPVSKSNDSNGVYAYTPSPADKNKCVEGMCKDTAVIVSDCFKARVYRVAVDPSVTGNEVYFRHNEGWGGGVIATENFINGEIAAINTTAYFLAKGVSGQPSLWQKTNTEAPVELLEGVEQMRITYATSENENYRLASLLSATDWSKVNSVRIELVVRSADNNLVDSPQPYTLGGVTVTPAPESGVADKYLRQVFTSTIGIRSRATNIQ